MGGSLRLKDGLYITVAWTVREGEGRRFTTICLCTQRPGDLLWMATVSANASVCLFLAHYITLNAFSESTLWPVWCKCLAIALFGMPQPSNLNHKGICSPMRVDRFLTERPMHLHPQWTTKLVNTQWCGECRNVVFSGWRGRVVVFSM